jgi:hypothetical protein
MLTIVRFQSILHGRFYHDQNNSFKMLMHFTEN